MRLIQQVVSTEYSPPVMCTFSGELAPMPGNPDVCISHGVYSHNGGRTGVGHLALLQRMKQAKELGYSAMLCTVSKENEAECKVLRKNNFTEQYGFCSRRTRNGVCFWFREL